MDARAFIPSPQISRRFEISYLMAAASIIVLPTILIFSLIGCISIWGQMDECLGIHPFAPKRIVHS